MSDITKVLAPNGVLYTPHPTNSGRVFVYVHGHRVYGTVRRAYGEATYEFRPIGKWAHLVGTHEYASV